MKRRDLSETSAFPNTYSFIYVEMFHFILIASIAYPMEYCRTV